MIEVRNLSRYYGDVAAISDISFTIEKNEIVGFLGLNGVGKSTTLKILAGLLSPSTGEVFINSLNWLEEPERFRQNIGFLPEEPPLYRDMTVTEFLRYIAKIRNYPKEKLETRLQHVLQQTQLTHKAHQVIEQLSLGYKKRVGIAQAIIHEPSLVILDEPTSGLDPKQMVELRHVIRSLSTEATVLLSSHNLTEVSETCDRLLILSAGKIIAEGNHDSLARNFQNDQNTIEVHLSNTSDTETKIQTLFKECKRVDSPTTTILKFQITSSLSTPIIVQRLVQEGLEIHQVLTTTSELESIFLSLTQSGAEQ